MPATSAGGRVEATGPRAAFAAQPGQRTDGERVFAKALTNPYKRSPTSLIRRVLRAAQDGVDAGPIAGLVGKHADRTMTFEVQLTSEVERFLQVGLTLY